MKFINQISVGEEVTYKIKVTEELHQRFMEFSGDDSPIHSNKEFAQLNGFKERLGYAFLLTNILSKIYGTIFPGGSELCLSQECQFPNPYYVDDELKFKVTVINKNEDYDLITIMTVIENEDESGDKKLIFKGKGVFKLSLGWGK